MRAPSEQGESAVTAVFGVAMFLMFLLVSAQALTYLFAASTVQAAAFDLAVRVSGAQGGEEFRLDPQGTLDRLDRRAAELVGGIYDEAPAAGIDTPLEVLAADARCRPVVGVAPSDAAAIVVILRVANPNVVVSGLGLGDITRQACNVVERPTDA